ncbi:VRR-NUC domain-containing protein [bacterium]|jgi:Holliday junction resolvase|nr:VRR-NUC domain-containing protein [bacterium]NBX50740.1 VRR-NUC domain-containing protein [bacterium]
MAQTPESKVKSKVTLILKTRNVYHFYPPANGFGRAGIPDIIACYLGQFIAFECKAKANKPTALQLRELDRINTAGGIAVVINENNIDLVETILTNLEKQHDRTNSEGPTA